MGETHDPAVLDRLIAAEFAFQLWEAEARQLLHAAVGAGQIRLVDGQHLLRAGELIDLIKAELAGLEVLALTTQVPLTASAIELLATRLTTLLADVQEAARELHGITR